MTDALKTVSDALYIFSQGSSLDPFVSSLRYLGSSHANKTFEHINDCMMEALDTPPAVIILDVNTLSPVMIAQIDRVRSAPECRDVAIAVRMQMLAETDILSLVAAGVNHFATRHDSPGFLKEVEILRRNPRRAEMRSLQAQTFQAKINSRLKDVPTTDIPPALLDKFQTRYGFRPEVVSPAFETGFATWGALPASREAVGVYAITAAGIPLAARKQASRLLGLIRGDMSAPDDPVVLFKGLAEQIGRFGANTESLDLTYLVLHQNPRHIRFMSTRAGALLSASLPDADLLTSGEFAVTEGDEITLDLTPAARDGLSPVPGHLRVSIVRAEA